MPKKILVTAGGTREDIDPVRYIGNYSSGKMGIAIADEAYDLGYDVMLISTVEVQNRNYKITSVKSADDMLKAVKKEFIYSDYLIMAAAVADYKPKITSEQKIKKDNNDNLVIELVKTPDILKEISKIKNSSQKVIGFCAESENLLSNAKTKLENKKLDYIIANDISRNDIGFGSDYNEITIISKDGQDIHIKKTSKAEIAKIIMKTCIID